MEAILIIGKTVVSLTVPLREAAAFLVACALGELLWLIGYPCITWQWWAVAIFYQVAVFRFFRYLDSQA